MEFEKFRERKTFGLRIALIDLLEKKKTSEKHISILKSLSDKKEDMKNINVIEFLNNNKDLELTPEVQYYLYFLCDITVQQAMDRIDNLLLLGIKGIPKTNIDLIEALFRNRCVRDKYPLEFKKRLVRRFKEYEKLIQNFNSILLLLTRDGNIDIELIQLLQSLNIERPVNFWWMSENEDVDIEVLDHYSNEELDWLAISYRADLPYSFICKHINKLCLELLILNNVIDKSVIDVTPKIKEVYEKMQGKSEETIKSECLIIYHFDKMNSPVRNGWDTASKLFLMSDDFMIEHWDYLNKELLVKYRKLSDRIKALL